MAQHTTEAAGSSDAAAPGAVPILKDCRDHAATGAVVGAGAAPVATAVVPVAAAAAAEGSAERRMKARKSQQQTLHEIKCDELGRCGGLRHQLQQLLQASSPPRHRWQLAHACVGRWLRFNASNQTKCRNESDMAQRVLLTLAARLVFGRLHNYADKHDDHWCDTHLKRVTHSHRCSCSKLTCTWQLYTASC